MSYALLAVTCLCLTAALIAVSLFALSLRAQVRTHVPWRVGQVLTSPHADAILAIVAKVAGYNNLTPQARRARALEWSSDYLSGALVSVTAHEQALLVELLYSKLVLASPTTIRSGPLDWSTPNGAQAPLA